MRRNISLIVSALLMGTALNAAVPAQVQVDKLNKKLAEMQKQMEQLQKQLKTIVKKQKKTEKKVKKVSKKLNIVKAHDAYDNVKFSLDFRPAIDNISYKYNDYKYKTSDGVVHDLSGTSAHNPSLLTNRLYLNMKAKPTDKVTFYGSIAMYGTWGGNQLEHDPSVKDWSESSKATDNIFRLRQAYVAYADTLFDGNLPYTLSVGRRPSTTGFLANYRAGDDAPGSPLAHITNMEVDAAMGQIKFDHYIDFMPGGYLKLVYGRAHTGVQSVYDGIGGYAPYASYHEIDGEKEENVEFFVAILNAYDDGQYKLMAQHATIFNTKGARADNTGKKLSAGTANFEAISFESKGIGNEINDFLDNTTAFASVATTYYSPDSGYQLLGSTDSERGYSYWLGLLIPDMMTDEGKFGFEFNHGSKYWTPMTWAEDTAVGSKISVRGDAYEGYWNFRFFGQKNLTGQFRYTYLQHDHTPNIRCSGWVPVKDVDIEAQDVRFYVRYQY
ncbi:DUF3373 family protein [Hydrogenimonas sp.]